MNPGIQFPEGYFGPHHPLVMEVLQRGMSYPGFAQPSGLIPEGVRVVYSLEVADAYVAFPRPGRGDEPISWEDLLEFRRSEYISPPPNSKVDEIFVRRTSDALA